MKKTPDKKNDSEIEILIVESKSPRITDLRGPCIKSKTPSIKPITTKPAYVPPPTKKKNEKK